MNSKKGFFITFLFAALFILFQGTTYASDHNPMATYVLLSHEGITEYSESFDFTNTVDKENFSKIYSAFFDVEPLSDLEKIMNRDAVYNLANQTELPDDSSYTITAFKDYGLIDKKYRDSYRKLCKAGYLNFESEYLDSNQELTYGEFFRLLSFYEEDFLNKYQTDVVSGKIGECTSKGNKVIIEVFTDGKTVKLQFDRDEKFPVYKNSELIQYDYNIKRNDSVNFYMKSDKIIFADVIDETDYFSDKNLEILSSKIYVYDTYSNQIILKTNAAKSYKTFYADNDIIIYKGSKEIKLTDLNTTMLDIPCYIIADTNAETIKYIYADN